VLIQSHRQLPSSSIANGVSGQQIPLISYTTTGTPSKGGIKTTEEKLDQKKKKSMKMIPIQNREKKKKKKKKAQNFHKH
jgi:hypothetical protein